MRPILARSFSHRFLGLADGLLNLAFDLLPGVTLHGAGNVVQLALDLFRFPSGYVFSSHANLQVKDDLKFAKRVPKQSITTNPARVRVRNAYEFSQSEEPSAA